MSDSFPARFLRFFFRHLYSDWAWSYDFVAGLVSLGLWRRWIDAALPLVQGSRLLELAFGTGMLQRSLRARGPHAVLGLDESRHMGRLAQRRLRRAGLSAEGLARGRAESLPYASGAFDAVVATFPSEFMLNQQTMSEVHRVLAPRGSLVVVAAAWITGKGLLEGAAARLFEIAHQSPTIPHHEVAQRFCGALDRVGFRSSYHNVEVGSSMVLVIVAAKSPDDASLNS